MNGYLIAILALLLFSRLLSAIVERLNLGHIATDIPDEFQGVYDEEKYAQSQRYLRETTRFGELQESLMLPVTIAFILLGGFRWMHAIAQSVSDQMILQGLVFCGILVLGSQLLGLPFSLYSTFVIEARYGFNKTTPQTFVLDILKGWLLGLLIGAPLFALVLWIFGAVPHAWLWAWGSLSIIQLGLLFIAPVVILPLFNRFSPLAAGDLRTEIEAFAATQAYRLSGIFTIDGSRRSTKSNAYFTGFGKTRRIALFDTLIEKHSVPELVAVLAHEVGHCKLGHIRKNIAISLASSLLMFFVLSQFISRLYSNDMGIQGPEEKHANRVPLPLLRDEEVIQEQPDQRGLTERYTEECVRFIRDNASTASTGSGQARSGQSSPFFLYLAHMYVHVPLFVPQRFLEQAENGGYGGAVECIDWVAGVIFDELQRQGLDDNTMVIFTSDNGSRAGGEGGSNAPLRGTKFQTWEGGQRVPCIVRWPGKVPAGRTCDELITSMDFLPTFAKLTGTTAPQDITIDGKDISPLLFDEAGATSPHETFWHYRLGNLEAVRKGKWKLHVAKGKFFNIADEPMNELYDLEADIGEENNLFDEHPEVVEELLAVFQAARKELGDTITGDEGSGKREVGRVENPVPLATYDENHPYIVAAYDTPDTAVMGG